jgi:iron complex outermembrane receptor protein
MMKACFRLSTALAPLVIGLASGAMAQTAPPPSATTSAAPAAAASDAIIVTARRSGENIQSVPVSVTAFSPATLRAANITKTADLMMKTPGVFLSGSGGRENSIFSIRGQSKALSGPGAAAVVSYFNDVPMPTFGSGVATFDLSSVQVLKGPQGTLFGRNTTGGAVLYYSTAPTYTLNGYLQGTYGNYDDRVVEGALNVPIIDQHVALRVSGQYEKRDGWTKNIGTGFSTLDDTNSRAFRIGLKIEPTDWLHNVTTYDYYRNYYNGDAFALIQVYDNPSLVDALGLRPALEAALAVQNKNGPRVVDDDMTRPERVKRMGVTNKTDIDISGPVQLVNIFGYRRTRVSYDANVDAVGPLPSDGTVPGIPAGTPLNLLDAGATQNVEQFTDEIQLKGRLGGDKLRWLVGGFWLKSDPIGPTGTFAGIGTVPGFTQGNFNYSFYSERSKALFANLNYDLGWLVTGLRANAGFRYTWDNVKSCTAADIHQFGMQNPDDCVAGNPNLINPATTRAKSSAPTWQFGLEWQATRDLFAYVTTRRGYRSGGVNSPTLGGTLASVQVFDPETVTDVEAGIRSDWNIGDVKLRLNASGFMGWYNKVQVVLTGVQVTAPGCIAGDPVFGAPGSPYTPDGDCNPQNDPASGTLLVNAGKTKVPGIDLDGRIAYHDFSVTFGATIIDPKQRKLDVNPAVLNYIPVGGIPFYKVAKQTVTAGAAYHLALADRGNVDFNLDYYYSSKVSEADYAEPSYDLFNARISWSSVMGRPVDLSVFATNLFDKKYLAIGGASGRGIGFVGDIYGAPRQYGVQLRYHFGS